METQMPLNEASALDFGQKQITHEYMRALEAQLTAEQKERAFELARMNGWGPGSQPPMWVWQQLFLQAQAERPVHA
jgi:hypothetical protein